MKFPNLQVDLVFLVLNGHFNKMQNINEIEELIKLIAKLPGLGPNQQKELY